MRRSPARPATPRRRTPTPARPALHHLRQRRRRQEHADRPPAGRQQDRAAGPARRRAARRRDRPGAAHRRPRGRARAGHHDRRGLPLLRDARSASSSSATRRATSSTPATWSRPPRAPTPPWCWSTPPSWPGPRSGDGEVVSASCCRRPAATRCWPTCCACRRSCSRSTSSTRSTTPTLAFERISRRAARLRRSRRRAGRGHRADLGAQGLERGVAPCPTGAATKARACSSCWSSCPSPRRTKPCPSPSRCSGSRSSPPRPTPRSGRRVFWGRVASGHVEPGQRVTVLPSGQTATVAQVLNHTRQPKTVHAGHSAGIVLDRELDVSRGDWLLAPGAFEPAREITATIAWLDDEPLVAGRVYWALQGHRWVKAKVARIVDALNITTLDPSRRRPARSQRHRRRGARAAAAAGRAALHAIARAGLAGAGRYRLATRPRRPCWCGPLLDKAPKIRGFPDHSSASQDHDPRRLRILHPLQIHRLRRRLSRGLLPRRAEHAGDRPGRMHRLRGLHPRMPGQRDLRRGRPAGQPDGLHQAQRRTGRWPTAGRASPSASPRCPTPTNGKTRPTRSAELVR